MHAAPAAHFFRTVRCPQCRTALAPDSWAGGAPVRCPGCRSELFARAFPLLAQPPPANPGGAGERAIAGEAACFFHPEKRAERSCDRCGRFVCALCDLPMGGRHLCPACLSSGLEKEKLPELVARRLVWSHLAFSLSWVPLVIGWATWPVLFFTGPVAIGVAIYGWNKPGSLVHGRRRWLALLAIVLGLAQLGGVVAFILFLWNTNV
jgi:hypothetical protein